MRLLCTMFVKTLACATLFVVPVAARAAVVYLEDFSSGANGWGDRDSGKIAVSHELSVGSPAHAAMQGEFASQGFPIPQTDAFSISSGVNFVGDYTSYGNGLTQIAFDLYSENLLPSDLFIRLISGANTFTYQFNLSGSPVDSWNTYSVNLTWGSGWSGIGQAAFNSALTSVSALEIQLTRNGTGAQAYYLGNIQTLDGDLPPGPGGGGGDAVPEPSQGLLYLGFMLLLALGRRRFLRPA